LRKEPAYFSVEYDRGVGWYRAHFPLMRPTGHRVTFEATPNYLFHPLAPERAVRLVPHARILVVLRNPVDRAVSHYHHMRRLGFETLELEEALDAEQARLAGDLERSLDDPSHRPRQWLRFSYVARGRYAEQLARWLDHYPRSQMMVLRSEDLYADPAAVVTQIEDWLGLARWLPEEFRNYSYDSGVAQPRNRLPSDVASRLRTEFEAEPQRLAALVDRQFAWW
jgi:hypothetical protein